MRLRALDDEVDPAAGDVDAGQMVDDLVDLGDHDAALERGGLDDRRRVLGVGAGVEVAFAVGGLGADQRHLGRQIDEVAGEELEVGVDRADRDPAAAGQPRQPRALRPGEAEVETAGDAVLEQVQVFGQRQHRLHHVQVVHRGRVERGQRAGQEVGLLLVVAFQADAVAGLDHRLQQGADRGRIDLLGGRHRTGAGQPLRARAALMVPGRGAFIVGTALRAKGSCRGAADGAILSARARRRHSRCIEGPLPRH